ncbi:MAG TPA: hypothetical protein VGO59_08880 [Verrucomicrobiae bacterium]|jgi:NDP-sugar pyrophosphorylase family protein
MKSVLICPGPRREVPLLSAETPLAVTLALGHGLVEYWMSHLACAGVKQVALLASDRADKVRKIIGSGSRWGLEVEVKETPSEAIPEHAAEEYGAPATVMDHFPGRPEHPLFASYQHWFNAIEAWMPSALTPERVGMRELQPGVWAGLHGHIARDARLAAPCWIGDHVYIGAGAVIGPSAVVEHGAFIEPNVEIKNSVIGASTFVGQYVRISHCLVWGDTQLHWQTGQASQVEDEFLLCSLHPKRRAASEDNPWLDRVAEWLYRLKEDQQPMQTQPIIVKR